MSRRRPYIPGLVFLLFGLPATTATFSFDAGQDFNHAVGRSDPDGWSADPAQDPTGYMMIGPGTRLLHRGFGEARIRLKTPAAPGPNDRIVRLEVVDQSTGSTLAARDVRRQELDQDVYRVFLLPFAVSAERSVDFNVWFYDVHPVTVDWVEAVTGDRELSRYGVNAHVPDPQRIDLAAAAHMRWLRLDFNWIDIEPQKGAYDWGVYDTAVDSALSHGQHVLANLAFTPDWATSGQTLTHPPDDMGDWFNFVYWTVSHFQGRVRYWSIWNEPNLTKFFTGTRADYINMLTVAADAVRQADPDAFVVGPELSDLSSSDWDIWLDEILTYNRTDLDIIAHHVYDDSIFELVRVLEGPRYPWETRSVREIMQDNGMGDTPLWLTETGWTSQTHGEQGQANKIRLVLEEMALRPWWSKTFIYELHDPPGTPTTWGILREDLSAKVAYGTYWDTALDGAVEAWILTAPGAGPGNPPYVTAYTWDGQPAMWLSAYGATGYGTRVTAGSLHAGEREKVVTGPGPGAVYGPQVRAFEDTAAPIAGVNYYAYGTLKYGVNVAVGDVDGDFLDELLTGGGPGVVFGPHVRGWNYDGGTLATIGNINYFAYQTPRYGVNLAVGNPDADPFQEIITGPGPSAAFGGQVRGWNYDGTQIRSMTGLNFFAFAAGSWGCEVGGADLDDDGDSELMVAAGPAAALNAMVRTFTWDGSATASYVDVVPFTGTLYGGRVSAIEVNGGGAEELLAGSGPDPSVTGASVALISVPASGPLQVPGSVQFAPYPTYAYGANVGALRLDP